MIKRQHTYNSVQLNQIRKMLGHLCINSDFLQRQYSELSQKQDIILEILKSKVCDEKFTDYYNINSSKNVDYRIWCYDSEPSGSPLCTMEKEKRVMEERNKYNLFIIREEAITHIFINGEDKGFKPSKIGYRILTLALKHRGTCGTAWNIAKNIYDVREAEKFGDLRELYKAIKSYPEFNEAELQKVDGNILEKVENISNRVRQRINVLNESFLNKVNTKLEANRMDEYELIPSINFCLIEKNQSQLYF